MLVPNISLYWFRSQTRADKALRFLASFDSAGTLDCYTVERERAGLYCLKFDPNMFVAKHGKMYHIPIKEMQGILRAWDRLERNKKTIKRYF